MVIQLIILILVVSATWLISQFTVPVVKKLLVSWQEKRTKDTTEKLEHMFIKVDPKKLAFLYAVSPLAFGLVGFLLFHNFIAVFIAAVAGLAFPAFRVRQMQQSRHHRFSAQLPDAIMIISSCLKGGLSLLQAIEAMADEMPAPISQEFGIILQENKMGVSLEESLSRLSKRMVSEDLNLMNTAILVARETGGNLPEVFSRLVTSIRAKANINETVRTMTVQGRLQGGILAVLPFMFVIFILKVNPDMVKQMVESEQGRIIIGIAALLQICGTVLIHFFSKVEV